MKKSGAGGVGGDGSFYITHGFLSRNRDQETGISKSPLCRLLLIVRQERLIICKPPAMGPTRNLRWGSRLRPSPPCPRLRRKVALLKVRSGKPRLIRGASPSTRLKKSSSEAMSRLDKSGLLHGAAYILCVFNILSHYFPLPVPAANRGITSDSDWCLKTFYD